MVVPWNCLGIARFEVPDKASEPMHVKFMEDLDEELAQEWAAAKELPEGLDPGDLLRDAMSVPPVPKLF